MSQLPTFILADELLAARDAEYAIANEVDLSSSDPSEISQVLTEQIDALANPTSVDETPNYAALLSLVKHYAVLSGAQRITLLDALTTAYATAIDSAEAVAPEGPEAYRAWAPSLEKLAFALQWVIHVAERASGRREERAAAPTGAKRKGKGAAAKAPAAAAAARATGSVNLTGYDWQAVIPGLLAVLARSLRLSTALLFPATATRDAFVSCALRPALLLQETEAHLKVANIKAGIFRVICQAVKGHSQAFAVQASIAQALAYYEHLAEPSAELLALLRAEYDYERLTDDVLRDVGAREYGGMDTKSPRAFAKFLVRLTELCPRAVLRSVSLLMKHLDSESYPMRNAMLEILGLLIKELTTTDDALSAGDGTANANGGAESGGDVDDDEEANAAGATGGNDGSADAQRGSVEARKKQVKHFWELLFERFLDVNSYVRVKAIQVCTRLCDLPSKFPSQRTTLANLAVQALGDKSASARKASIALLTRLVLTHPYGFLHGGELDEAEWTARLEGVDAELKKFDNVLDLPAEAAAEEEDEEEEDDSEEDEDEVDESIAMATPRKRAERRTRKRRSSGGAAAALDVGKLQASSMSSEDAEKVMRLRLTKRYYVDALQFIAQLGAAMPTLTQLLVSTSKAEVLESMEFFRVAHEYKLPGAQAGIRKMIHLIWTKDNALVMEDGAQLKGIRSRLLEVYRALYFEAIPELSARDNVSRIARNMVERTFGATLAELTSLEELLRTMCAEDMVHPDVVAKLWSVYGAPRALPRAQRRGAIIVLSMLAVARREIVAEHIDALLGVGLGPLGARDIVLAKYTCVALARVGGSVKKVKGALSDEQVRFPMTHAMFAKLRAAILWHGAGANGEWFSLAEHAVQTIYQLGEQPDALCSEVVKAMTARVFGPKGPTLESAAETPAGSVRELSPALEETEEHEEAEVDEEGTQGSRTPVQAGASQQADASTPASRAPAFALAQLLFVVGHVALKQIVYLELVEREFKRRKADADKAKLLGDKDGNTASAEGSGTASKRGKKGKATAAAAADAPPVDDLEQVAGNAEDEIGDIVGEVREKELLYGPTSLLSLFGPVVAQICSSPKNYPSDFLRKAAVLSMCKFMCVSSEYCEAHLPLLLSIMEHSTDAVVRSNVVIALGDIAVSFGNLVDENSERLYAGLADADLGVKKHTLMVLTHLILNGMIKVKGQLGEMAKCLEDEEERVSDLAKLFFSELATKENAVYNNLPDIISHLSIGQNAVDEDTFARTMRFIFTFIDKERQAENVVEKLCQRFRMATLPRQWRDIAFCLSLLPYKSERSVKRLMEGLPFYQDKLHDQGVFESFTAIVAKARQKPVGQAAATANSNEGDLAEFEQILEQYRSKGEEESALAKLAKAKRARGKKAEATFRAGGAGKKAAPTAAAAKRKTRARVVAQSDDDNDSA